MPRFLHTLITCLLLIPLLLSPAPVKADDAVDQATQPMDGMVTATDPAGGAAFAVGEVLVGLAPDRVEAAGLAQRMGFQVRATVDLSRTDAAGNRHGAVVQTLAVPPGQEQALAASLAQQPDVLFAEPNWIVRAALAPPPGTTPATAHQTVSTPVTALADSNFAVNDPLFSTRQWYMSIINAEAAWAATLGANRALEPITVAVVDSGVQEDHPELVGRVDPTVSYVQDNFTGSPIYEDDFGHGTHIAGLIGAMLNNGQGIAGLTPSVRIRPYKVLNSSGGGRVVQVAAGIEAAAIDGADIINLSLELPTDSNTMRTAVEFAHDLGALIIAAAGNSGDTVQYPGAYPEAVAVAATTADDTRAYYSPYGGNVDFAAPGGEPEGQCAGFPQICVATTAQSIYSLWSGDDARVNSSQCLDTCGKDFQFIDGGYYGNAEGTSFSAGIASGAAALIWGLNPDLSREEVRMILTESATPLELPVTLGSGRLDLAAAVGRVIPADLQLSAAQVSRAVTMESTIFTETVSIQNPSTVPMDWTAELAAPSTWISITSAISGTVTGDSPATVDLQINTGDLAPGLYVNTLTVRASSLGIEQTRQSAVHLLVAEELTATHFPLAIGVGEEGVVTVTPGAGQSR